MRTGHELLESARIFQFETRSGRSESTSRTAIKSPSCPKTGTTISDRDRAVAVMCPDISRNQKDLRLDSAAALPDNPAERDVEAAETFLVGSDAQELALAPLLDRIPSTGDRKRGVRAQPSLPWQSLVIYASEWLPMPFEARHTHEAWATFRRSGIASAIASTVPWLARAGTQPDSRVAPASLTSLQLRHFGSQSNESVDPLSAPRRLSTALLSPRRVVCAIRDTVLRPGRYDAAGRGCAET